MATFNKQQADFLAKRITQAMAQNPSHIKSVEKVAFVAGLPALVKERVLSILNDEDLSERVKTATPGSSINLLKGLIGDEYAKRCEFNPTSNLSVEDSNAKATQAISELTAKSIEDEDEFLKRVLDIQTAEEGAKILGVWQLPPQLKGSSPLSAELREQARVYLARHQVRSQVWSTQPNTVAPSSVTNSFARLGLSQNSPIIQADLTNAYLTKREELLTDQNASLMSELDNAYIELSNTPSRNSPVSDAFAGTRQAVLAVAREPSVSSGSLERCLRSIDDVQARIGYTNSSSGERTQVVRPATSASMTITQASNEIKSVTDQFFDDALNRRSDNAFVSFIKDARDKIASLFQRAVSAIRNVTVKNATVDLPQPEPEPTSVLGNSPTSPRR